MSDKPDYQRLTPAERDQVRRLCTPERSNTDVARIIGCAASTIRHMRLRDRLPPYTGPSFRGANWRAAPKVHTEPDIDPAVQLYRLEKARRA